MAGTNSGFDAAGFRAGIHFAMQMGAPVSASDQVKFYFAPVVTSTAPVDGSDLPFDPAAASTSITPTPITVPCAVEYARQEGEHDRVGFIVPSRLRILLLDVDYVKVADCSYIVYGGDRYDLRYEEPPNGLFDVGVHALVFVARGER
jgi:hypothetical protein